MNVVEFIKKHEWVNVKNAYNDLPDDGVNYSFTSNEIEYIDENNPNSGFNCKVHEIPSSLVKPYLDAHLLVEENGGLEEAKEFLKFAPVGHPDVVELSDAVNLVEEVENDR